MATTSGNKILATDYNNWWTSLNNIRKSWNKVGTTVTPPTVTTGTKATATDMNSLINQVNALKTFYSGGDWANFTEATKAQGGKMTPVGKMEYMLNYLKGVCAHNSTQSTQSTNGTHSNFGDFGDCNHDHDRTAYDDYSDCFCNDLYNW